MQNDTELIVELKKGDALAFDKLFHLYSDRLYWFSKRILKNKEDSEEIVQDVFLKIWEQRAKIDEFKSFKSYLFTIAYNSIISKIRNKEVQQSYVLLKQETPEFHTETEAQIIYSDLESLSNKIIDQLPPKRKQIFLMSRVEGLTSTEIAEKLSISKNTVENQITDALKFIREKFCNESLLALLFFSMFLK